MWEVVSDKLEGMSQVGKIASAVKARYRDGHDILPKTIVLGTLGRDDL